MFISLCLFILLLANNTVEKKISKILEEILSGAFIYKKNKLRLQKLILIITTVNETFASNCSPNTQIRCILCV